MSNNDRKSMRAFVLVSTITSYVLGGILGGVFLGLWLDNMFGAEPLFLIVFLLFGMGTSTYGIYKVVQPFLGDDE
ncbi:AtpZ/AtpI family protein [Shouchella shacheensis]|uniref:AtpZ/AtpI family protein n=1 Tax=Shouchella shacheensis TaxID=1649580 RepID=UPI00073FB580|nr:AtpZ/AtpI family protein [Shouchella shacheensis]